MLISIDQLDISLTKYNLWRSQSSLEGLMHTSGWNSDEPQNPDETLEVRMDMIRNLSIEPEDFALYRSCRWFFLIPVNCSGVFQGCRKNARRMDERE